MYTTRNFSIIFVTLLLMSLGRYVVADGDSNLSPVYQPAPTYSSPNGLQPSALFKVIPSSAPVKSDKDSAQADQPIYNPVIIPHDFINI